MTIEKLAREDIPAVAALERECFAQPWSERVLEVELQNPNALFWVAKQDGELAGYVGMHQVLDEGYIANVAVTQAYRRQGVATRLLEALLAYAQWQRMGFITLEVRVSNRAGNALYEKLGFGQVGRRKRFYADPEEDALLLTCFLGGQEGEANEDIGD